MTLQTLKERILEVLDDRKAEINQVYPLSNGEDHYTRLIKRTWEFQQLESFRLHIMSLTDIEWRKIEGMIP